MVGAGGDQLCERKQRAEPVSCALFSTQELALTQRGQLQLGRPDPELAEYSTFGYVHGGIGYTRKYPIEPIYRDARLNWIEEGAPTIQYMVAARELLDG